MATASVRELRNHFPKVKKMVEMEGEVIVTDNGTPKYKLTMYTPAKPSKPLLPAKDYLARLSRHQPKTITAAEARSLDDENRGSR